MSDEMPAYSGRILGAGNDKVTGWLTDRLGCRILFEGTRDKAGGGYLLRSTSIEIPEHLQVPLIDGEV